MDELSEAINGVLETYDEEVVTELKKLTKKAMKDLVNNTKADAPVGSRHKHYRACISSETVKNTKRSLVLRWYVKGQDYRLSHLLNNGHSNRDGGRTSGTNFIGKNAEYIEGYYLEKIKEVLSRD